MSFFGSGISGSLTDEMLLFESFLLMVRALLSGECLGTSTDESGPRLKVKVMFNIIIKVTFHTYIHAYIHELCFKVVG